MRQKELDDGIGGTAGKLTSHNACGGFGETQMKGTYTTIDTTPSQNKTKPTPQDTSEESSVPEVANTTTSSSTPVEEENQKVRRKPTRVRKLSL